MAGVYILNNYVEALKGKKLECPQFDIFLNKIKFMD